MRAVLYRRIAAVLVNLAFAAGWALVIVAIADGKPRPGRPKR